MKIIYIREAKETCDFIKRIVLKVKYLFNVIDSKDEKGKTIYYLPILSNNNVNDRKIKKLSKSIARNLEKDEVYNVVISKYLGTMQKLKNTLYSRNINILDGRYLFKCLTYETIEYILKIKNKEEQTIEISMLINDFSDINKDLIINIAKKIKTLNIITNHINKCKKIEKYLYNEFGIVLNISNNKKSSLLKSELILNIDFPAEIINQYNIYNNAIIINVLDKIPILQKKFNGININYFKINIPKKFKMDGFKEEEIYESIVYKKKLYEIKDMIIKDKIKIRKLMGNNGYIKYGEFIQLNNN